VANAVVVHQDSVAPVGGSSCDRPENDCVEICSPGCIATELYGIVSSSVTPISLI
jgi:hypothetical protein